MRVTCPCGCNHTFDVPLRKGNYTNVAALAARKASGNLGGRKSKTDVRILMLVYASKRDKDWTGDTFLEAIQKATGVEYSRRRAFYYLSVFRNDPALVLAGLDVKANVKTSLAANFESEGITETPESHKSTHKEVWTE
jgi:hypothetical protein